MKVIIDFPKALSLIQFNPFLGEDIELYQQEFEKWYSKNYTPYIGEKNKKGNYNKTFDAYIVIDWIKEVAPESKPVMIAEEIDENKVDSSLPRMYF